MNRHTRTAAFAIAAAALASAAGAGALAAQSLSAAALIPGGFGTLSQDDIDIRFRTDELEVRFVPLDDRVLRLLAPDGYRSLTALIARKQAPIDSVASAYGTSRPGLALVTFFAQRSNARFDASTLFLIVRGRFIRPLGTVPLNPAFTSQQLDVRGAATAIYVFDEAIPVTEPFGVSYGGITSDDWRRRLESLDRERQRVASRARVTRLDSTLAKDDSLRTKPAKAP